VEIDSRTCFGGQAAVAAYVVSVKVRIYRADNFQPFFTGYFKIGFDTPLGINDQGLALRTHQVRGATHIRDSKLP
jgi:hypothetical protein